MDRHLSSDLPGTTPLFGVVGLEVAPLLGLGLSDDSGGPLSPRLYRCRSQRRPYGRRGEGTTAAIVEAQRLETCHFPQEGNVDVRELVVSNSVCCMPLILSEAYNKVCLCTSLSRAGRVLESDGSVSP